MFSIGSVSTGEEVECLNLSVLLANIKKSLEYWFLSYQQQNLVVNKDEIDADLKTTELKRIHITCLDIVLHRIKLLTTTLHTTNKLVSDEAQKLYEDFEWVRKTAENLVTESEHLEVQDVTESLKSIEDIKRYLSQWVWRNLKQNCLCKSLEILVTDKDLIEYYYENDAFLRTENYATALFVCLTALELKQSYLLSQIDANLYNQHEALEGNFKRSNSDPNLATITLPKDELQTTQINIKKVNITTPITSPNSSQIPTETNFAKYRLRKSLPILQNISENSNNSTIQTLRPRSKTLNQVPATMPRKIPITRKHLQPYGDNPMSSSNTSSSLSGVEDNMQPSTSASSRKSQSSTSAATSMSTSTSSSSVHSMVKTRRIEIIKCDDIKIWTDQSVENRDQQEPSRPDTPTSSRSIPQTSPCGHPVKNVSPLNSFLSSLFGTPPTYTSWAAVQHTTNFDQNGIAYDGASPNSYPCNTHQGDVANSSGVFDAFLPVYGKKLRARKSQTLFEDGISSLDYSVPAVDCTNEDVTATADSTTIRHDLHGKNKQSLTAFLQMSQLSRNNTDLEKENAHFRISEAIISAIEHIKYANMERDNARKIKATTVTATDWLNSEASYEDALRPETESPFPYGNEHSSFAELEDSCTETLSAEVVGLSLISKFNDKHLPKVSELKWLVSEDDAPQKLLPMPDNSPTVNPDENVMPSITRGTRYWAPPRPQIIFTDFPIPNRKLCLQKQNNRCAGCGMRVSPQYMYSFRYCTYLGKYHCTGCHRNQIATTPAKILQAWDFKLYPVSVFAYRLLEQMYTYPLFHVPDLNAALYIQQSELLTARKKRIHLKFVKDFIRMCRFATREQKYFDSIPDYITDDVDIWSMSDFVDTHNGSMKRSIDDLIERCENHIFNCVLCTARGFLCEHCSKEQVIYPWCKNVYRCECCGACFHLNCWKLMLEICCRCQRIKKRQNDIAEDDRNT